MVARRERDEEEIERDRERRGLPRRDQVPKLVVTLEIVRAGSEMVVLCTSMAGEELTRVVVSRRQRASLGAVREVVAKAHSGLLRLEGNASHVQLVSTDGRHLTGPDCQCVGMALAREEQRNVHERCSLIFKALQGKLTTEEHGNFLAVFAIWLAWPA